MENKNLQELYQKLVKETVEFCNEQKLIYVEDLIKLSSSLVCFASDLLKNNTDLPKEEIETLLQEALKISVSTDEDLEFVLSNEVEDLAEEKQKNLITANQVTKNNKLLN